MKSLLFSHEAGKLVDNLKTRPLHMTTTSDVSWLTGTQVNARYSISPMTRYRWERDPDLAFPMAMKINRRKFWQLSMLEIWERGRTLESAA